MSLYLSCKLAANLPGIKSWKVFWYKMSWRTRKSDQCFLYESRWFFKFFVFIKENPIKVLASFYMKVQIRPVPYISSILYVEKSEKLFHHRKNWGGSFAHRSSVGARCTRVPFTQLPAPCPDHEHHRGLHTRYLHNTLHYKQDPIDVFLEMKGGLIPNFHIHVSVSDLYIPTIGPPI